MSCNIPIISPPISINLVTKEEKWTYIFVGEDIEPSLKRILKKIEVGTKLLKDEEKILYEKFPEANRWKNVYKFIYEKINLDDSLSIIKKKIFINLSNPDKEYFIPEKYQEIWLEPKANTYKILGFYYLDKETSEILELKPSIYSKLEIDYNFVDKDGAETNKYELVSNDPILYDAIDILNLRERELYVANAFDLLDKLKKSKITKITDKLLNGYIKKFWPEINLNITISDILKNYKETKVMLERENKIIKFVENAKIDPNKFSNCSIIHARVHINFEEESEKYVDLLKIFNHLREKLSPKMPFLKYKDPDWDKPYSAVYEPAIKDRSIDEAKLIQWLYVKWGEADMGEIKITKGLTIKILTYEFNNKKYYGTVNIFDDGRIEFIPSYVAEYDANIETIIKNLKDVEKLIEEINQIDYSGIKGKKMDTPMIKLVGRNLIIEKPNTKIISLSTILDYRMEKNINYNDLFVFSKIFTPYITYKIGKLITDVKLTLLYKRISNFTNMSEIFRFINEQIRVGRGEYNIIMEMAERFDKSVKDATNLYNEYQKRYSGSLTAGVVKETGIPIIMNKNTKRVMVNNASEYFLLVNANRFVKSLLTIYENLSTYRKDPEFRKLMLTSDEYIESKVVEEEEEIVTPLENVEKNIEENIDLDLDIDEEVQNIGQNVNIDISKYININKNIEEEEPKEVTEGLTEQQLKYREGLAPDSEIDPNIKLACDDPIPELDICEDLCNTRSYFLRRLQRHDPKLFKYPPSAKYKKYSKVCQANVDIQPIVMKNNPETDPRIDRDSYTYAIKYGSTASNQNYYICPKVWCPYDNIPISYSKVKNIRSRMTVEGRCVIGTCPYGDHEVFIMTKNHYRDKKFNKGGLFPGFAKTLHPDGLCLPCCYSKPQNIPSSSQYAHFKKCLGEDIEAKIVDESFKYILGSTTYLQVGRFGLLSPDLANLFNTRCEQGFIKESCYLRKGVEYNENQGFLEAIADIVSEKGKQISVGDLKRYLASKLDKKLFLSLNNGTLETVFKGNKKIPYENFKDYLLSDERIDETYLWDFLSRPNILYPEGCNLVLFTETSIICPVGFNAKEFFIPTKRTIFAIKYEKIYNPIYYVKYDAGDIIIQKFFSSLNKYVMNIIKVLQNNCVELSSVNWKRILKDNEKKYNVKYDIDLEKEFTIRQTIKELGKLKKIKIVSQIIDEYNKCVGLLLNSGLYLPVKPGGILTDYDSIEKEKVPLLNYKILREKLEEIYKKTNIPCEPMYKIYNDKGNIIAIELNTGRLVPVKESKDVKDRLPSKDINYFYDADEKISKDIKESDKRIDIVTRMEYEQESYQRIRYELSKYLRKNQQKLKEIREIIESDENIKEKRDKMRKLIIPIIKDLISIKNRVIDWETYITPNIRTVCSSIKDCTRDPHCVKDGGKCKLHIFPKNLITGKDNLKNYMDILIEELLRNRTKREDLLNDKISDIIDKQKILPHEDEVIFFGKYEDDYQKIIDLYRKEKHLYISDIEPFDTIEPKFYGIDKEYLEIDTAMDENIELEPLSVYWSKILGEEFMVYKAKESSLFFGIVRALNYLSQENENVEDKFNTLKLKRILAEYDYTETVLIEIAKKMGLDIEKHLENDDEQDLILKIYKLYNPHVYKDINSVSDLKSFIQSRNYEGTLVDIYLISYIFKINFALLSKRLKKDSAGLTLIREKDFNNYILLYSQYVKDRYIYDVIEKNGKYVFKKYELPERFRDLMEEVEREEEEKNVKKKKVIKIKTKPKTRKITVKKSPESRKIKVKKIKIKK